MQYKTGQTDDKIKPYRKPRLTDANCAIDPGHQARLYARAARRQGLEVIHVFPVRAMHGHSYDVREVLTGSLPPLNMVQVDPEDWK